MFVNFALLCPGILLSVWTLVLLTKKKNTSLTIFNITVALCAIHILTEGIYLTPNAPQNHIAIVNMVRQISGPMVLPFVAIYIRALCGKRIFNWVTIIWFILIISQTVAIVLFILLLGEGNANAFIHALRTKQDLSTFVGPEYSYYKMICVDWYDILLLIQMTYITIAAITYFIKYHFTIHEIIDVYRGKSARFFAFIAPTIIMLMIVCGLRRIMGDQELIDHPYVSAVLMLCLAFLAQMSCYACSRKRTDLDEILYENNENHFHTLPAHTSEDEEADNTYELMCQRLDKLMEQERLYLHATLSIDFVAKKLNVSQAYLAWLIKHRYNMKFREYINRKRIEYAKLVLREKPEALLEYIASQSGYLSTSAFSKNFLQYVGMPPRLWTMNQMYKEKNKTPE